MPLAPCSCLISNVAVSLNNLANLYSDQARFGEAELLYKRALGIREQRLGPDNTDVAASLNDLAVLYNRVGRYAEAEHLYKRALKISEKVFGGDHPNIAASLNNFGVFYVGHARFDEAKPLFERALHMSEKLLGPNNLETSRSLNNLGGLYNETGENLEAEPLYKRALEIKEEILGSDHPEVAAALNNLEKRSGVDAGRPQLQACPGYLREGDTLLVTKLDRLARSTSDLYRIISDLTAKGVAFKVLDDPSIDTTSRTGKLIMGILALIAEFENDIRRERQMAVRSVVASRALCCPRQA